MQPTVQDVMTADVVVVHRDTPYTELLGLLHEHRVHSVPVVDDGGILAGLVSEADLLGRKDELVRRQQRRALIILPPRWQHRRVRAKLHITRAQQLMRTDLITVPSDLIVAEAADLLRRTKHKCLLVTNPDGRLLGIVTRSDLPKGPQRPDREICYDVKFSVIDASLGLDATAFDVKVRDGVVTLAGPVVLRSQARAMADLARDVAGVSDVVDHLRCEQDDTHT